MATTCSDPRLRLPDGPATLAHLRERGLSRRRVRTLVADGVVRQVLQGVYVPTSLPDDVQLRAACAAMVLPAHCVVVDRSAAALHGVDVLGYAELQEPPPLEVASLPGHEPTRRRGVLGGKRDLIVSEITEVAGVRVTAPARTACDVACLVGRARALAVLDAFRRQFGLTEADLLRAASRFAGRRGVVQLRELIALSSPDAESQPESWTRMMIIDDGLPAPRPNLAVWVDGWGWTRLDLAYEFWRIAVEFDGEQHHRDDADRAHDRARRAALRRAGWYVIVITRGDLAPGERDMWLGELRDAIAGRTPPVGKRVYSRAPRDDSRRRVRR